MIKKQTLILLLGIFLLVLPMVNAADEKLFFYPDYPIDLKVSCFDTSSALCLSTSNCELTIFYPNMSVYVDNESMTYKGTYYNYTANASSLTGVYKSLVTCHDGTNNGYTSFDFYVGRPSTAVQSYMIIVGILFLFGFAVLLFVGYIKTTNVPLKYTLLLMTLLFFLIGINVTTISLINEVSNANIINIFDMISGMSFYAYWFIIGLIFVIWVMTIFQTLNQKGKEKIIKRTGG